jgi:hypothetical protein
VLLLTCAPQQQQGRAMSYLMEFLAIVLLALLAALLAA